MGIAPGAVLPPLHALRVLPLVLIGEEVAVFALGALQNDLVSRHGVVLGYQLSVISYQLSRGDDRATEAQRNTSDSR
jgi:hypothetical protein